MTQSYATSLLSVNQILDRLDRDDLAWLTDAIAVVYGAIAATPEHLLQEFDTFPETLLEGDGSRAQAVVDGVVQIDPDGSDRAILLDAAQLLRALEQAALEQSRYIESDRPEDLEDAWRTSDGCHYVLPRLRPLRPGDNKPFLRRALRYYRVLPTEVGGFAVRLHRTAAVADTATSTRAASLPTRHYGAAFFPGLKAGFQEFGNDGFLVDGLTGFDAEALLREHVTTARAAACVAIAWAELTMPQASIAALQALLAETALDGGAPFRYLVAGSWHREAQGAMRNVGAILDGGGRPLFDVLKWAKFKLGARREEIEAGNEIQLIIDEDNVAVVAICRDFLQDTREPPYQSLDVDIAIVPSMTENLAEVATMQGHAAAADSMRIRFGTRVLVVAQPAKASTDGAGRVHAFPAKPLARAEGEIVAGAWHRCDLDLF